MYLFKHRPLLFSCTISLCMLAGSYFLPMLGKIALIILAVALCAIVFLYSKKRTFSFFGEKSALIYMVVCIMCFITVLSSLLYYDVYAGMSEKYFNKELDLRAYLTSESEGVITEINGKNVRYNAVFDVDEEIDTYTYFTFRGNISGIDNYYEDISSKYKSDGIFLYCSGKIKEMHGKARTFSYYFDAVNRYSQNQIYKYCGEEAGFLSALVLGSRENMPSDVKADFAKCGISHLYAISGFHLTAVLAFFEIILKVSKVPKKARLVIMIMLSLLYIFICGASHSVLRAGIMYFMCRSAFFSGNFSDSLTSLFFSAYLICTVSPYALFDVGLMLSFAATFGIVAFGAPGVKFVKFKLEGGKYKIPFFKAVNAFASSVIVSASAFLFTLPVLCIYYDAVAIFSAISTLILSPTVTVALYLVPLVVILSFLPAIASFLGTLAIAVSKLTCDIVDALSRIFDLQISLKYIFTLPVFIVGLAVLFVLIAKKANKKHIVYFLCAFSACYLICCSVHFAVRYDEKELVVESKNGELLCVTSQNKAVIYDNCGGYFYEEMSELKQKLYKRGITSVDSYVLSNYTENVIKNLKWLSESMSVDTFYFPVPDGKREDEISDLLKQTVNKNGSNVILYDPESKYKIENNGVEITVLQNYNVGNETNHCLLIGENNDFVYIPYSNFSVSRKIENLDTLPNIVIYRSYPYVEDVIFSAVKGINNTVAEESVINKYFTKNDLREITEREGSRIKIYKDDIILKIDTISSQ